MGVDSNLYLPVETQADDVAKVLSALVGDPPHKHQLDNKGSYAAWGGGVKATHQPTSGMVIFEGNKCPWMTCHYNTRDPLGNPSRFVMTPALENGIALLEALGDFFGGILIYSDCEDINAKGNSRVFEKPRFRNDPEGGKEWHDFQDAILAVEPLPRYRKEPICPS